ncbi:MAG: endo-1,4-beta-xylanase [Ignavibacteria bacterium]|nr:endo-1,4-beta-xylanase [Ignavibacteria bacterium]
MKKCVTRRKEIRKNSFLFVPLVITVLATMFPPQARPQTDTIQTNVPALKNVYAKDFTIGCLLSYRNVGFSSDPFVPGQSTVITPNGGYLIKFHMNSMSPGNNMKPQYTVDLAGSVSAYNAATTSQAKDSVDIRPIIRFNGDLIAQLNWAKRQGFTFCGHTLVWHSQTPGTGFFRTGYSATGARLTKEQMTNRMENYIKEVFRLIHEGWPGLLSAVDVVNEAINDNGTDRTTDSEWWTTFQDNSYIMKAFELARKYTRLYGETQIKLYYNDYNTHDPVKADGIVRLLTPIFLAGFLDGIGMQEHDANTSPTAEQWIASYNKFYPICTEMAVTELDVTTGSSTPSASALATQANQYGQLFKCFVARSYKSGRGKIINVSKDGLNDQYTFKTNQASSLWDARNLCKPAFYAVANVGHYYNSLDSLIAAANTLQQNSYTTASWFSFAAALTVAKDAKDRSYSASVSADTELANAKDGLKSAVNGLVKVVSAVNAPNGSNPVAFALSQNYPNPFSAGGGSALGGNPTTAISFHLPARLPNGQSGLASLSALSTVRLIVYDALGREVATLVDEEKPAGSYTVLWNARNLPSGVYVYRIVAGDHVDSKKMLLTK